MADAATGGPADGARPAAAPLGAPAEGTTAANDAALRRAVEAIRGEGLVLDALQSRDADRVAEACSSPEFERFMATPWPYERRHAEYFVGPYALQGWRSRRFLEWAIREREGGEILGAISLRAGPPADIGYWLAPDARGRGVMTRAVRLVAGFAFSRGVRELAWECIEGNLASAAVARRAGFEFAGAGPATVHRDAPAMAPDAAPDAARPSAAGASAAAVPSAWFAVLRPGAPDGPRPGWPAPFDDPA